MSHPVKVIAIDGPVAAGKTVVGLKLASRLGFQFLDTGVMYRAITWLALHQSIPVIDNVALGRLAQQTTITLVDQAGSQVKMGEHQVGRELREPRVEQNVSQVAQASEVRQALVQQQRKLAQEGKIVMVGRDIGTVVLPGADLKVFLTASPEERARRRWLDLQARGSSSDYQQVLQDIEWRDHLDSTRSNSPLTQARDAVLVTTDGLEEDQVVELLFNLVRERCGRQE